jgi:hypothetical protein
LARDNPNPVGELAFPVQNSLLAPISKNAVHRAAYAVYIFLAGSLWDKSHCSGATSRTVFVSGEATSGDDSSSRVKRK